MKPRPRRPCAWWPAPSPSGGIAERSRVEGREPDKKGRELKDERAATTQRFLLDDGRRHRVRRVFANGRSSATSGSAAGAGGSRRGDFVCPPTCRLLR